MTIQEHMYVTKDTDTDALVAELEHLLKFIIVSCDTQELLIAIDQSEVNQLFAVMHRRN